MNLIDINSIKKYKTSPLPFLGQKRSLLRKFNLFLQSYRDYFDKETIFLDCFGGSGLLSNNIKALFPNNKVIYNDYDNFTKRLELIPITNKIKEEFLELNITNDNSLLSQSQIKGVKNILDKYKDCELDFITISTWVMFAMNYAKNRKELYENIKYNNITFNKYCCDNYLSGIYIVSKDAIKLLKEYQHKQNKVLILDPPYIQTERSVYTNYFKLSQFLEMLELIQPPYILFCNDKSDNIPLFDFLKKYISSLEYEVYKYSFSNVNSLNMGNKGDTFLYNMNFISRNLNCKTS